MILGNYKPHYLFPLFYQFSVPLPSLFLSREERNALEGNGWLTELFRDRPSGLFMVALSELRERIYLTVSRHNLDGFIQFYKSTKIPAPLAEALIKIRYSGRDLPVIVAPSWAVYPSMRESFLAFIEPHKYADPTLSPVAPKTMEAVSSLIHKASDRRKKA